MHNIIIVLAMHGIQSISVFFTSDLPISRSTYSRYCVDKDRSTVNNILFS